MGGIDIPEKSEKVELEEELEDGLHLLTSEERDRYEEFLEKLKELEDIGCKIPYDREETLLKYLRVKDFDVSKACSLALGYYRAQELHYEIRDSYVPSKHINFYRKKGIMAGKRKDEEERAIVTCSYGAWDLEEDGNLDEIHAAKYLYLGELLYNSFKTQVNGVIAVVDFANMTNQLLSQFSLRRLRFLSAFLNGALPVKVKQVHVLNQPVLIGPVYKMLKPFLKRKIRDRIIFHGSDFSSVHSYVSPDLLPVTFQGNLSIDDFEDHRIITKLLSKDEYYTESWKYGFHNH